MDTLPPARSHAATLLLPGSDGWAFGQFLRRAREDRGLTLQQLSDQTKIPTRHLSALEHGNLSAIPSGIYRRADIRAFAKLVGLDQNLTLAQFQRALESSGDPTAPAEPSTDESRPRALAVIGIVSLMIGAMSVVAMCLHSVEPLASEQRVVTMVLASYELAAGPPPSPKQPPQIRTSTQSQEVAAPLSETTVTPSASGVARGQLIITTEPTGARVTVNGVGWGVTPITIRNLPTGDQRIRVTKDGYASAEWFVFLSDELPGRQVDILLRVRE